MIYLGIRFVYHHVVLFRIEIQLFAVEILPTCWYLFFLNIAFADEFIIVWIMRLYNFSLLLFLFLLFMNLLHLLKNLCARLFYLFICKYFTYYIFLVYILFIFFKYTLSFTEISYMVIQFLLSIIELIIWKQMSINLTWFLYIIFHDFSAICKMAELIFIN